jgi:hypothetical protein
MFAREYWFDCYPRIVPITHPEEGKSGKGWDRSGQPEKLVRSFSCFAVGAPTVIESVNLI